METVEDLAAAAVAPLADEVGTHTSRTMRSLIANELKVASAVIAADEAELEEVVGEVGEVLLEAVAHRVEEEVEGLVLEAGPRS